MKYILNEGYANEFLTTQCGHIFKKDIATEVADAKSHEVEMYIKQKFIIPFTEAAEKIKAEIKSKEKALEKEQGNTSIERPKGVSTINSNEKSLKSVTQENKPNVDPK